MACGLWQFRIKGTDINARLRKRLSQMSRPESSMNAVNAVVILCDIRNVRNESRLTQERICACLFMAEQVDSRSGIEAVDWQAVWRHDEWMLWRHKCMFQASDLLRCETANFRKTHGHHRYDHEDGEREQASLACCAATEGSQHS